MTVLVAAAGTPVVAQQAELNVVLVDTSGRVLIEALGSNQQHQLAPVSDKVMKSPRWSPDGSQVALISEPACPPNPVGVGACGAYSAVQRDLVLYPRDGGTERIVGSFNETTSIITWFPNSSRLLLYSGATARHVDAVGINEATSVGYTEGSGENVFPALSQDGSFVAYEQFPSDGVHGVIIFDANSGEPRQVFADVGHPVWTQSNDTVIVADRAGVISSLNISTGEMQSLVSVNPPVRDMAVSPDGSVLAMGLNQRALLLSLSDADATPVSVPESGYVERVVWLPDSSGILAGVSPASAPGAHLEQIRRDGTDLGRVADLADASDFDIQPLPQHAEGQGAPSS